MKALVLNQDFRPISVCSIQRAFVLVFNKKVEMVASFNGHKFHTVDNEYSIPAVIRLQCYIKVPYRSVELSRKNIFERDNHTCQYCGSKNVDRSCNTQIAGRGLRLEKSGYRLQGLQRP